MPENPNKCPECAAYNGEHAPTCSLINFEQAKVELHLYYHLWLEYENKKRQKEGSTIQYYLNQAKYWKTLVERWQGKYAIVKLENNALRKKLEDIDKNGQIAIAS